MPCYVHEYFYICIIFLSFVRGYSFTMQKLTFHRFWSCLQTWWMLKANVFWVHQAPQILSFSFHTEWRNCLWPFQHGVASLGGCGTFGMWIPGGLLSGAHMVHSLVLDLPGYCQVDLHSCTLVQEFLSSCPPPYP